MTISREAAQVRPERLELPPDQLSPIPEPGELTQWGLTRTGAYVRAPLPPFVKNDAAELALTEQEQAEALARAVAQQRGLPLSVIETERLRETVAAIVAADQLTPAEAEQVLALVQRQAEGAKYGRHLLMCKRRNLPPEAGHQLALSADELAELAGPAEQAARRQKYQRAYNQWSNAKGLRDEFPHQLTAEQWLALFQARADHHVQHEPKPRPRFEITEHNQKQIWLLCLYFAGDQRFESEYGYRLGLPLLLRGRVGCGKSTILSMFGANPRQSFQLVSCRGISDAYEVEGVSAKVPYYGMLAAGNRANTWNQDRVGIAFDDLGTENWEARHRNFGTPCNVMADILCQRWDGGRALPGGAGHVTTNLSWAAIESTYKARVYSRMRGGYNDIRFPNAAPDWRQL